MVDLLAEIIGGGMTLRSGAVYPPTTDDIGEREVYLYMCDSIVESDEENAVPIVCPHLIDDNNLPFEILTFDTFSEFPEIGESGKLYKSLDDNKVYKFSEVKQQYVFPEKRNYDLFINIDSQIHYYDNLSDSIDNYDDDKTLRQRIIDLMLVDDLTTDDSNRILSANQGKILKELVETKLSQTGHSDKIYGTDEDGNQKLYNLSEIGTGGSSADISNKADKFTEEITNSILIKNDNYIEKFEELKNTKFNSIKLLNDTDRHNNTLTSINFTNGNSHYSLVIADISESQIILQDTNDDEKLQTYNETVSLDTLLEFPDFNPIITSIIINGMTPKSNYGFYISIEESKTYNLIDVDNKLDGIDEILSLINGTTTNDELIEILNKIENLKNQNHEFEIENYTNGIRIKLDGTYVFSQCFGSVTFSSLSANVAGSITVDFPFQFQSPQACIVTPLYGDSQNAHGSFEILTNVSVIIHGSRTTAGSLSVRWVAMGR